MSIELFSLIMARTVTGFLVVFAIYGIIRETTHKSFKIRSKAFVMLWIGLLLISFTAFVCTLLAEVQ